MNTSLSLAHDYFRRAVLRAPVLDYLRGAGAYCDVVREAQAVTELVLKGYLRLLGIDPPHWHDVGPILSRHEGSLCPTVRAALPRVLEISKRLRKEREISFYGEEDFLPLQSYTDADAGQAIDEVRWLLALFEPEFDRERG